MRDAGCALVVACAAPRTLTDARTHISRTAAGRRHARVEKLGGKGGDKDDFLFRLNLNRLQADPNSVKTLNKKEHGIRKQITDLENSITLWRNNLDFFAASKTADKLREQFDVKIQKAEEEIDKLKKKLTILKEF